MFSLLSDGFLPPTRLHFFIFIQSAISQAYSRLLPKTDQSPPPPPNQFLCQLSNISQCLEIDGQEQVTITSLYSL